MAKVLHTSDQVRSEIRRIFRVPGRRRVAIVAYVGRGALAYLPKPKGLELYCWPQAGGTSAKAVRNLQKSHVIVSFADRVHMKVFWAEGVGAVVGSANLSDNALGVGGLHEAGVLVPASRVQIDDLIRQIEPTAVTEDALRKLAAAEAKRKPRGGGGRQRGVGVPSFPRWLRDGGATRWKWGYFDNYVSETVSKRARAAVQKFDHRRAPVEVVYCKRSQYRDGDWILNVRLTSRGLLTVPEWVYVHHVVLVEKTDRVYNAQFPYQAVQAYELRQCPSPPFRLDGRFKKALRGAAKGFGEEGVRTQVDGRKAGVGLLRLLAKHYKKAR